MPTGAQGTTLTLDAFYVDGTGVAVTPTSPRVSIINPSGTTLVSNATPTLITTGHYEYAYAISAAAPVGSWTARWTGTINGVATTADEVFTVVTAGSIGFSSDADVLTLDEGKAGLNMPLSDTTQDTELAQVITAASRWLDGIVGPVVTRSVTETHHKPDGVLWLRQAPADSITSVTEYSGGTGTALTAESITVSGGYLHDRHTITRRATFYDSYFSGQAVEVVYNAGRYSSTDTVDAKFKDAAAAILQFLWQQRGTNPQRAFDPESAQAFGGVTFSAQGVNKKIRAMLIGEWVPAIA